MLSLYSFVFYLADLTQKPIFNFDNLEIFNNQINELNLPQIIVWAVPVMLSLVALEYYLERKDKKEHSTDQPNRKATYNKHTFLPSVLIGLGNLISTALAKVFTFGVILFFFSISPLYIEPSWWSFIVCFVVLDFCRYWAHYVAHRQRFWWATHVTHHSSEDYNFTVSFRLSWVQQLKVIFFVPVALLGFHPLTFFICHQIAVLNQFWIHTEQIRKMPVWFEYIFVTPSHHRVHHGTNEHYLDKNFGSTFIIWDRIFGTFEPEGEEARYGITEPIHSKNPVRLVFHEFVDIAKDLRKVRSPKQAFKVLFSPPGTYEPKKTDNSDTL
ncbi:sterol desaturase family protein [Bernardetia sp. ABR2-2B]|uniref:sterol desaturase family protein n=1 Tax=Bernardetia sp. ABR2-2B TaxID=3127472 RepID=UPI0030D0DE1E